MIYWLGVLHISCIYIQKVATLEKKKKKGWDHGGESVWIGNLN